MAFVAEDDALDGDGSVDERTADADVLAGDHQSGVEEHVGDAVVPPIDEEVLVASQVDGGNLAGLKAGAGGQNAADEEVKIRGGVRGGIDKGDEAAGEEFVLRDDADGIGKDGGGSAVKRAGNLNDGTGGEAVDGVGAFPLGLVVDVDGELAAARTLHYEGVAGSVDADYAGDEFVDEGVGVRGSDGFEVDGRIDDAGDLIVGVNLNGFAKVELEAETDDVVGFNDQRLSEIHGDARLREGNGRIALRIQRGDRRTSGRIGLRIGNVEVTDLGISESDGYGRIGPRGNGVEIEQRVQAG